VLAAAGAADLLPASLLEVLVLELLVLELLDEDESESLPPLLLLVDE